MTALELLPLAAGWVGHACIWTAVLNNLYGRPITKTFLKPWRAFTGLMILAYPVLVLPLVAATGFEGLGGAFGDGWTYASAGYAVVCLIVGVLVFPAITFARLARRRPAAVLSERSEVVDYRKELGPAVLGSGNWKWAAHLPLNDCFRVEYTDLELAVRGAPAAWDGLTILFISDTHFYGSPGRPYYDAVFDRLAAGPQPDLVILGGDYLDKDCYHEWIQPLFGRLTAAAGKFAVLGNHDDSHDATRVRKELEAAGCTVLGNGWREITLRGERCVVVGNESPWYRPEPDLSAAPADVFRLCVSHTPDNFYWGQRNKIGLMVCGHVHGGQIRLPVIGSIFVPSVYGRRFDQGVFAEGGLVMAVGRGLSGKEPLRFSCKPQVLRITLRPRA
ncbi:metallophosphoesterase [Fimbriiglobus ruber]|uniref:Phosphoesterase n=1 Tax=Fimbriiglobus ruber TaxID=1908690 RepID=A0A225DJT0_9BACT|nr:metallophosphoesterase [Fimbriiglobus ruber]OWK41711.1 Phosphoesterase [Fimbriiglobus ruber]